MDELQFLDAVKFHKNLPHQIDAWKYLQTAVSSEIKTEFAKRFRNSTSSNLITRKQLSYIWNRSETAISDQQILELNSCLKMFEITTKPRIRHFISQCSHESNGGIWMKELASGDAYEGRTDLGNTQPGDGRKFKGAGFIQVTGKYFYQKFSDFIKDVKVMTGVDYVSIKYPFTVSGYWWNINGMNKLCDSGATCRQVSARVNGKDPANGLTEREKYYGRCVEII